MWNDANGFHRIFLYLRKSRQSRRVKIVRRRRSQYSLTYLLKREGNGRNLSGKTHGTRFLCTAKIENKNSPLKFPNFKLLYLARGERKNPLNRPKNLVI
jgi:hypothetical protein